MKKIALSLVLLFLLFSCSSSKSTMNGWIGASSRKFINNWGSPIRILNNGDNGQIFVYANQIFIDANPRLAGPSSWNYFYVYVNTNGEIVSIKNEKHKLSPPIMDLNKLIAQDASNTF